MRASILAVVVAAVAVAVAGCGRDSTPTPGRSASAIPSLDPVALPAGRIGWARATLNQATTPRVGADPTGPVLTFDTSGDAQRIDAGRTVTIVSEPAIGPDGAPWVHAWLDHDPPGNWPYDFVAWYPVASLRADPAAACPPQGTFAALAALRAFDRERCAGSTEVSFDARTGSIPDAPMYDSDPAWYGTNGAPGIALYDPGEVKIGPGAVLSASEAGAWLDARVPPTVAVLPMGFFVRVHGHFGDVTAATCTRSLSVAGPVVGAPVEAPADSAAWCRSQFVVTAWEPLLGPEGRPVDPAAPQLHRQEFVPPPGVAIACGGVGMSTLTVRIDPAAVDPVWIESGPERSRSVAVFGNAFGLLLDPPRVAAANGVTLVDGEQLDPDRSKPGLDLCPGGDTIWFDVRR